MSDESRHPDDPGADPAEPAGEPLPSPTVTPSPPESSSEGGRDRGRTIAFGVLGGLVVLSAVLVARGPRSEAPAPAATLTGAVVPASASAAASGSASAAPSAGAAVVASADGGAAADAAPKYVPTWRVSALKLDGAVEVIEGTLGKRPLAGALTSAGLSKVEAKRLDRALDGIRRIDKGQPKDTFVIARDRAKGTVVAFEYIASPTDVWQVKADESAPDKRFVVRRLELFVEQRRSAAGLAITADLPKAVAAAGLREEALHDIDDALDGHIDLATLKAGVRMRVVGSEEWVEGTYARFHVDALEYVPRTGSPLRVYRYERDASVEGSRRRAPHPGFYDAKGQSPFRGTFRSPLPLARVTSRFNPKRMHPVLHVVMPHNGVDFGASSGTPVYASAPGTISTAGDGGPCGNMVQIEHAGGLSTAYCHLSRFAPGVHPGQHVEARELVGFVGKTGRATGPHLHFAVKRGGVFIDPLAIKMDGVRTLPPADREAFAKRRAELDATLDAVTLPALDGSLANAPDEEKDEPAGEE